MTEDQTKEGCERQALMEEMFSLLQMALFDERFEHVNEYLHKVEPSKLHPIVGVGLLRCCAAASEELEAWGPLYERVEANLLEKELPAENLLRGLPNPKRDVKRPRVEFKHTGEGGWNVMEPLAFYAKDPASLGYALLHEIATLADDVECGRSVDQIKIRIGYWTDEEIDSLPEL